MWAIPGPERPTAGTGFCGGTGAPQCVLARRIFLANPLRAGRWKIGRGGRVFRAFTDYSPPEAGKLAAPSLRRLAKDSGVAEFQLRRFRDGGRTFPLASVDALCRALELSLTTRRDAG
jgi:hypothetical protein